MKKYLVVGCMLLAAGCSNVSVVDTDNASEVRDMEHVMRFCYVAY